LRMRFTFKDDGIGWRRDAIVRRSTEIQWMDKAEKARRSSPRLGRASGWSVVRAWPLGKSGFPRSWTPAFRRLHRGRRWNGGPSTSPGRMAPACAPRRRRRPPPRGVPVEAAGGGPSLERVPGHWAGWGSAPISSRISAVAASVLGVSGRASR